MKKTILLLVLMTISSSIYGQTKKTVNEDFNVFFKKFNQSDKFQLSRVFFPLKIQLNNENFELENHVISKENYEIIKFNKHKLSTFKQKVVLKNSIIIIQERGIDNGIFTDFIFEQRKGLWYLKTWIDEST